MEVNFPCHRNALHIYTDISFHVSQCSKFPTREEANLVLPWSGLLGASDLK